MLLNFMHLGSFDDLPLSFCLQARLWGGGRGPWRVCPFAKLGACNVLVNLIHVDRFGKVFVLLRAGSQKGVVGITAGAFAL